MNNGEDRVAAMLAGCSEVLGVARVSRRTTEDYTHSTTGTIREITGVIAPASTVELQACVRLAREHNVPLYPISTGRNWGYGAANPVCDGCVVVDLGRMRAIHDFDPELGVVTVEPGVTQGQLREFLDEADADYLVPVTGAGPSCSLLGNALERGYGITPFTDHFSAVTSVQAVMADGGLYSSPLSELGGAEVDRLFKWGTGPYIDGLFSQGNFGIVTRMTLALAPSPERVVPFFFSVRDQEAFERTVPVVRQILREFSGQVPAINLLNRQRMLSMLAPFPKDEATDGVLSADTVARLARQYRIETWSGVGAIYGTPELVRTVRRRLKQLLKPSTTRLTFVTERNLSRIETISRRLPQRMTKRVDKLAGALRSTLDIMRGRPNEVALALAYWRSGTRPPPGQPMNPARDGCGLIWYAPLVPLKAESVTRYLRLVEEICPRHGLNPLVTLTSLNARCFDSTVPLLFDRNDPDAVSRAQACYSELVERGTEAGFVPYRLNNDAMGRLSRDAPAFSEVAARLKTAMDPAHLIAPGRYVRDREP